MDLVVFHIKETHQAEKFQLDFFTFADTYLQCKSEHTRASYVTALGALERFIGVRSLDVNDITRHLVLDFAAFVDAEPRMRWEKGAWVQTSGDKVKGGASAMYTAKLAHIFAAAKFQYNDEDGGRILIPRSPFDGQRKAYPPSRGQKALSVETMQAVIDAVPETPTEAVARDVFLLSFCLMGANLADLWGARSFAGDVWTYNRRKTAPRRADKAEVRVSLPAESSALIARLGGQSGQAGEWWLPVLHQWKETSVTQMVNKGLRRWCEREGVAPFTFYAARKTWATLARKIGVEKATVDEALAHVGDFRATDIYAERNWSLAWDATRRVLALFNWEGAGPGSPQI